MSRLLVVPATVEHAVAMAPLMREADLAELVACGMPFAEEGLRIALEDSEMAFALMFDDEVGALFGLVVQERGTVLGGDSQAIVWALTGRAVDRHRVAFLRASRHILALLLEQCAVLVNWVDARYALSLRWLAWLGFEVGEPEPFGPEQLPFHPVVMRRSQWVG